MKKILFALSGLVLLALVIAFFIPSVQKNQVFISNTLDNIAASTMKPASWIKWDSSVRDAWQKDSTSCNFHADTVHHSLELNIPGKKITVTQINYLLYQLEETKGSQHAMFIYSIVPYIGNGQPTSFHNVRINYDQDSRLLYKILPFLKSESFADKTISGLKSYLDDPARFYGLPIQFKNPADTIFLTQQATVTGKQDIFKTLPYLFKELDSFAVAHHEKPTGLKNVSFEFLPGDTTKIVAGIHIKQVIEGDYLVKCQQLPGNQVLVSGTYEGAFRDRFTAYRAMEKYLYDHQLLSASADFEKYLSPLPVSDTSIIKIELIYPLRSSITQ
ncbi:MAG: hypothetical protein Q8918_02500 [Bacteroidota bacterium]|nr:hypothetical protein [Bacteroidota bacterium]MDP4211762.1 hypothetical protein [Bacteroidota bacterium]MDP4248960.1 hypothetical protein [Bacteroidota bacterium]